jgi:tRNA (adenine22-N1)-methyltransferase
MSKRIELTPRLRMVADLIPVGARLADVGTDHAYLPAALIQEGKISCAIAADLRQGPLSRAKTTVRTYGLTEQIHFRLCDGLQGISPDEVDAVAIAGMGGETIASILSAAPWVKNMGVRLALQPMSSLPDLRQWLEENGYHIVVEELAREGDTLYTALLVEGGVADALTPAERLVGRNCAHPLRGDWLDLWIAKIERAMAGLAQSKQEGAAQRRSDLEGVHQELLTMKKEWESWQR